MNQLGIPLAPEMIQQTPSGLREDELVAYWHKQYPWQDIPTHEVAMRIEQQVAKLVRKKGTAIPDVDGVIRLCLSRDFPLAIASGSSLLVIDAAMNKLNIVKDISVVCTAYSVPLGKPDPAVYLKTLEEINRTVDANIQAKECLVFEDSAGGIASAKAAGMKCIAVPSSNNREDLSIKAADKVFGSLEEFNGEMFELL